MFIIAILLAYLIGSIPTSYIIGRLKKGIDIRSYGSGNVGATNTLRVLGKKMGILALFIDMAKGAFCVIVLTALFYNSQLHMSLYVFKVYLAAFAVFGHIWTVFLRFKGGKGIATSCGVALALIPIPALIAISVCICVISLSKYVSLGSLVMMASLPFLVVLFKQPNPYLILFITLLLATSYTHKENIKRLLSGKESKITKKNDPTG